MISFESLIRNHAKPMNVIPTGFTPEVDENLKVRAVLFDIYGTLFISSAGDIGAAKNESSTKKNEITELCTRYAVNLPAGVLIDRFFEEIEREKKNLKEEGIEYPEVVIEKVWFRVLHIDNPGTLRQFALEYEMIVNPVYPMPGVNEILSICRQKGTFMGIISNAQFYTPHLFTSFLGHTLAELGFRRDLLFFSFEMGYGKPSVRPFAEAARTLEVEGIKRYEVLYVGNDMLKDIAPARKTGFKTALFAGDARSLNMRSGELGNETFHPDLIITDLSQIIPCLA
ncbi:MAG: HAD family hydrolase [Syntrophales bacterium]|jgi:putative hydrolase of the HAD superfamily|nr:HAD family hydrolase [Syntrophales bacterium]MDY0043241.1 HAD family hydrolase [Syntrophales bacterium]